MSKTGTPFSTFLRSLRRSRSGSRAEHSDPAVTVAGLRLLRLAAQQGPRVPLKDLLENSDMPLRRGSQYVIELQADGLLQIEEGEAGKVATLTARGRELVKDLSS